MPSDEHDLTALRELLLAEIKRVDQVLVEREKQVNYALGAANRAAEKADTEAERARVAANEWRGAMQDREQQFVTRQQHDVLQSEVNYIRKSIDQSTGRRAAWIAAAGIIATLIAIGVGQIIRQGITASDVSQQIQREAPWNRDKEQVERRIALLEAQIQRLQVQVTRIEGDLRAHAITDSRTFERRK